MAETLTKTARSQDAEKAQEKKRRLEFAPGPVKALADGSLPLLGLLGVSAMELPEERHAALLGDSRFSHSVNNSQKAGLVAELQQTYGNGYVQRLVEGSIDAARVRPQFEQFCPLGTAPRSWRFGGVCHTCPEPLEANLTPDQPNDEYEREADQTAEAVLPIIRPKVQGRVGGGGEGSAKTETSLDVQSQLSSMLGGAQTLPDSIRILYEPRYGYRFNRVRIHADARAGEAAAANACAFTVGQDIVFGEGQYAPRMVEGQRLLAHELTHVVQQGSAICSDSIMDEPIGSRESEGLFEQEADRVAEQVVGGRVDSRQHLEIGNWEEAGQRDIEAERRQSERVETKTVSFDVTLVPQKGAKRISHLSRCSRRGFIQCQRTAYFVIGDRGLDIGGGVFLQTLEALRDRLVALRIQGEWSLTVSIHGSENFVANAGRAVRGGPGSYDAAAITRIFGDEGFRQWRDQWGPVRIVLNACQVGVGLERTVIGAITRPVPAGQPRQPPYGLGTGCRPDTEAITVKIGGRDITTRVQYARLSPPDRQTFEGMLGPLNTRWGYFGMPPVPAEQILNYYFDEAPRGSWVVVRVSVGRVVQDIPFWNRGANPEFRRVCTQGVVQLPERQSRVPPIRETP